MGLLTNESLQIGPDGYEGASECGKLTRLAYETDDSMDPRSRSSVLGVSVIDRFNEPDIGASSKLRPKTSLGGSTESLALVTHDILPTISLPQLGRLVFKGSDIAGTPSSDDIEMFSVGCMERCLELLRPDVVVHPRTLCKLLVGFSLLGGNSCKPADHALWPTLILHLNKTTIYAMESSQLQQTCFALSRCGALEAVTPVMVQLLLDQGVSVSPVICTRSYVSLLSSLGLFLEKWYLHYGQFGGAQLDSWRCVVKLFCDHYGIYLISKKRVAAGLSVVGGYPIPEKDLKLLVRSLKWWDNRETLRRGSDGGSS